MSARHPNELPINSFSSQSGPHFLKFCLTLWVLCSMISDKDRLQKATEAIVSVGQRETRVIASQALLIKFLWFPLPSYVSKFLLFGDGEGRIPIFDFFSWESWLLFPLSPGISVYWEACCFGNSHLGYTQSKFCMFGFVFLKLFLRQHIFCGVRECITVGIGWYPCKSEFYCLRAVWHWSALLFTQHLPFLIWKTWN